MEEEKQIRILPMSKKDEFPNKSIEEVQEEFFMGQLIKNGGRYNYRKTGMDCYEGSTILFQFDGVIIACAKLIGIDPISMIENDIQYNGAYILDKKSIHVFEPITAKEISAISSEFKFFSQAKQEINYKKLRDIQKLIREKSHK
jgi:hypothetical protein